MKILVTGFDPFGGETVNPAYEAVKLLPDTIGGAQIFKLEIPTVFSLSGPAVEEGIKKYQPDVVLCVGQAGGRASISVEKVAINFVDARIPDNNGEQALRRAPSGRRTGRLLLHPSREGHGTAREGRGPALLPLLHRRHLRVQQHYVQRTLHV